MPHKDPEVRKAYIAQYNAKNRERIKAKQKAYYEANKEKLLAQHKAYAEANKEKVAAYKKQWFADNKERMLALQRQWYQDNEEHVKQRAAAWKKANRERLNTLSKKHIKAHIDTLSDYYVNLQIRKGTSLKSKDIPKGLTEAKRVAILIERELRETLPKGRRNPEKRKEYMQAYGAAWRERNREYIREQDRRYRTRVKAKRELKDADQRP